MVEGVFATGEILAGVTVAVEDCVSVWQGNLLRLQCGSWCMECARNVASMGIDNGLPEDVRISVNLDVPFCLAAMAMSLVSSHDCCELLFVCSSFLGRVYV